MTIQQARMSARTLLQNSKVQSSGMRSATPNLDVDCLLAYVLRKERSWLLAHSDEDFPQADEVVFFEAIKNRLTGLPIAYITGKKEFFGYDFFVTLDVLIPKPDTELLVEYAIKELAGLLDAHCGIFASCGKLVDKTADFIRIADICTGSGCIAVAVLKSLCDKGAYKQFLPSVICDATDISRAALSVAKRNADTLLPVAIREQLQFFEGDLLTPLFNHGSYHLIMSNPPYVPSHIVDEILKDGRNEPRLALDGDVLECDSLATDTHKSTSPITDFSRKDSKDGLAIICRLIPQVWKALIPGGIFLLETGEYNATEAAQLMTKMGFCDIVTSVDLGGQPRLTRGKKPV